MDEEYGDFPLTHSFGLPNFPRKYDITELYEQPGNQEAGKFPGLESIYTQEMKLLSPRLFPWLPGDHIVDAAARTNVQDVAFSQDS